MGWRAVCRHLVATMENESGVHGVGQLVDPTLTMCADRMCVINNFCPIVLVK